MHDVKFKDVFKFNNLKKCKFTRAVQYSKNVRHPYKNKYWNSCWTLKNYPFNFFGKALYYIYGGG
jgi:hypothetical protein